MASRRPGGASVRVHFLMLQAALLLAGLAGAPAAVTHHATDCDRQTPTSSPVVRNVRSLPATDSLPDKARPGPARHVAGSPNLVQLEPRQFFSRDLHGGANSFRLQDPPAQTVDRWLAEDKLKHFFASFAITALAGGGARAAGLGHDESIIVGVSVGTFSSFYKEVADARAGTFFSARDLVWDIAGISLAFLILSSSR